MKAYYITSDTHIRKMRLIADNIAEIFKFKNRSVGNFAEYIILSNLWSELIRLTLKWKKVSTFVP